MPMITPNTAATSPATTSPSTSDTLSGSPAPAPFQKIAPAYAPTAMKPAWPSGSWPRYPVAMFSDTARMT